MTRTILQFTLQGRLFGAWESDVSSVVRGHPLHHLPLSPACVAGMSIIDDKGTTVIDTGACIGLIPQDSALKTSFLLVGNDARRNGYRVEGSVETVVCDDDRIFPLPGTVGTEIMRSCVVLNDSIIPIIEIGRLQDRICRGIIDVPESDDQSRGTDQHELQGGSLRLLSMGDDRFCVRGTGTALVGESAARIREIPASRGRSTRLLYHEGTIIAVLPVREQLGFAGSFPVGGVVVTEYGGNTYGLAVTTDQGLLEPDSVIIKPVPPIVRSSIISDAVIRNGDVIPRIDLKGVIAGKTGEEEVPLANRYRPDASFPSLFRKGAVGITEVALFGGKHGIPQSEVREILPYSAPRRVPLAPAIVLGVVERDGKILPVLDLAAIFGKRSPVDQHWKLVRIENGDFEALVAVEQVFGEKLLPPDVQRQVPILLPYDVLYGCYLDDAAVRLIVNVQSLTVHFEKTTIREFMSSFSPAAIEPAVVPPKASAAATEKPVVDTGKENRLEHDIATGELPFAEQLPTAAAACHGEMPKAVRAWSDRSEHAVQAGETSSPGAGEQERRSDDSETVKEAARIQAENELRDAEACRLQAEEDRKADEAARIKADEERLAADAARMAEERKRQELMRAQEEERKKAESEAKKREQAERERAAAKAEAERRARERLQAENEERSREERRKRYEEQQARAREKIDKDREPQKDPAIRTGTAEERPSPIVEEQITRTDTIHGKATPVPEGSSAYRNILLAAAVIAVLLILVFNLRTGTKDTQSARDPDQEQVVKTDQVERRDDAKPLQKEPEPPLVLAVPKAMPVSEPSVYVVVKGDTLWGIAKRFTGNPLNYPRVAKDNSIATPDLIFPGQRIRLKNE